MNKMIFSEFIKLQNLMESRIAVPETTLRDALFVAISGYFSYISYLIKINGIKVGQDFFKATRYARQKYGDFKIHNFVDGERPLLQSTLTYYSNELPDSYKTNRPKNYKLIIQVGETYDKETYGGYSPKMPFVAGLLQINISNITGIEDHLGEYVHIKQHLHEIEYMVKHELEHVTQDSILRLLHKDQFIKQGDQQSSDSIEYYNSPEEFQPQITSAVGHFLQSLEYAKSIFPNLTPEQINGIFRAFTSNGNMPQGLLRLKPYFRSSFFQSIKQKSIKRWQLAVKELAKALASV